MVASSEYSLGRARAQVADGQANGAGKSGERTRRGPQQQLKNVCGIQKRNFKIKGWLINSHEARAARTRQTLLWSRACCARALERQRSRDWTIASVTPECYGSIPKCRINLEDSAALLIDSPLPY